MKNSTDKLRNVAAAWHQEQTTVWRLAPMALALTCAALALAGTVEAKPPQGPKPPPSEKPAKNPYFGDLHVHTARSLDAGLQGVLTTPAQAYEYAKGAPLAIQGGQRIVQLARPLDFAAVTDHAEYFGNFALCNAEQLLDTEDNLQTNPIYDNTEDYTLINCPGLRAPAGSPANLVNFALTFALSWLPESSIIPQLRTGNAPYCFDPDLQDILGLDSDDDACQFATTDFWDEAQEAAENANDPGRFTAFKAWEWTGGPLSANLHRNIIFRNENVPERPISYFEAPFRGDIWKQLGDAGCQPDEGDCQVVVIPHNSNLSQGRMFETVKPKVNFLGQVSYEPMDEAYASQMADYERLVEVMQHKGQSECVTAKNVISEKLDADQLRRLSTDEGCDFEIVNWATLAGEAFNGTPKPQDFIRDGLKEGVRLIDSDTSRNCDPEDGDFCGPGLNPFKYGLIASTDTHQGTPGMVDERIHPGHGGGGALFEGEDGEGNPDTGKPGGYEVPKGLTDTPEYNPGGLAVVWARSNTRDDIFEALQRKEVYGTSGTRPIVRFYGGFDLPENLCGMPNAVAVAENTDGVVPMGGDLAPPGDGRVPRFALSALMDPGDPAVPIKGKGKATPARPGTRLQQIQIIKGWVDGEGMTHEKVYTVGGSTDTGATVNTDNCQEVGKGKGFKSLCSVWEDPEFDAEQNAFYYGRVLENPTCRWSTYQCNAAGVTEQYCAAAAAGGPAIPEGFEKCCSYQYPPDTALVGSEFQREVSLPKTIQERAWTTPIWYEK